jgi:D-alanyl-D-alanine carboxypeptidase
MIFSGGVSGRIRSALKSGLLFFVCLSVLLPILFPESPGRSGILLPVPQTAACRLLGDDAASSNDPLSAGVSAVSISRGTSLYSKDSDTRASISSAARLITAVIALETLTEDTQITISVDAEALDLASSQHLNFVKGEKHTVSYLVSAVLYRDSDAAALSLAEYIATDELTFVTQMNDTAKSIGMSDTYFTGTSIKAVNDRLGNPDPTDADPYSTLSDVMILFRYALQNKSFRDIFCQYRNVSFLSDGTPEIISNPMVSAMAVTPDLLGLARFSVPGEGFCVLVLSSHDGFEVGFVTRGTPDDQLISEIGTLINRIYSEFEMSDLVKAGDSYLPITIEGAKTSIRSEFATTVQYIHPTGDDYLSGATRFVVYSDISLPVGKGDALGVVQFILDDQSIVIAEVVSSENVWAKTPSASKFLTLLRDNLNLSIIIAIVILCILLLSVGKVVFAIRRLLTSRRRIKKSDTEPPAKAASK